MNPWFESLALVLLLLLAITLVRLWRGPDPWDRMLTAQYLSSGTVALLVLLSMAMDRLVLLDVALVFALLAALAGLAYVRLGGG